MNDLNELREEIEGLRAALAEEQRMRAEIIAHAGEANQAIREAFATGATNAMLIVHILPVLSALIRSHPDPEGFAEAFRSKWRGSKLHVATHPDEHAASQTILDVVEQACAVDLQLRR